MIETKDLTLTVEKQVPGELVTNALAIETFVAERIKDFTPERYYDNPDAAKADRAVLNAAAKALNDRRLSLEREFMSPFTPVKDAIKRATDMLTNGASKLDEIVKAVEETIKAEKRRDIEQLFSGKKFDLLPLDRIFDAKWLNKTTPMKDVDAQLSAKIQKIYSDIQVIEDLPGDASDIRDTKAQYLESLDIGSALATAKRLRENRERIEREKSARPEREHAEHLEAQAVELRKDSAVEVKSEAVAGWVAEALEIDIDPTIVFVCEVRGTRAQIMDLRQYMTAQGIEYRKVEGVAK